MNSLSGEGKTDRIDRLAHAGRIELAKHYHEQSE